MSPAFCVSGGMVSGGMVSWILLILLSSPTFADKTPCKVCRDLTDSFKEHFDKTTGLNYGGGNTAWEEKSLGVYATSETRLLEILEKICGSKDYKCGSLLEDQEEYLEDWFFNRQDKTDLFEEMCVEHLKRCCNKNRWGLECWECPGGVETPCSGHGSCHGEGERADSSKKHHGTCTCDKGYSGTQCEECKNKYVKVGDTCEECSSVCEGQCVAPGPTGCTACAKGYELLDNSGCTDINECEGDGCGDPLEDCVNSDGSYECVCKSGFARVAGKCQLEELYANEDEDDDNSTEATSEEKAEPTSETLQAQKNNDNDTNDDNKDEEYEEVDNDTNDYNKDEEYEEVEKDNESEDTEPQTDSFKSEEL